MLFVVELGRDKCDFQSESFRFYRRTGAVQTLSLYLRDSSRESSCEVGVLSFPSIEKILLISTKNTQIRTPSPYLVGSNGCLSRGNVRDLVEIWKAQNPDRVVCFIITSRCIAAGLIEEVLPIAASGISEKRFAILPLMISNC